ncbi:MAG: LysR family transcriptional regulator [Myxococcales bacterium]|nr:LysR family transcriptional regulator [Myxococcales bacterium]
MAKSKTVARTRTVNRGGAARASVDLHDVQALVSVIDSGSFTKAASRVGLPKSALSRRVTRLEQSLGVRLLQRTTRSLSLTEAGAEYHRRATLALGQLSEASDVAVEANQEPAGLIRVTGPVDVGTSFLAPALVEFVKLYPKVCIEVDLTPRFVDLVAEGFDLAVRAGKMRDSSLVARMLGKSRGLLVASPDYIAQRGHPKDVADLVNHECILFRPVNGAQTWVLEGPEGEVRVTVRGALAGSDFPFIRSAALAGAGIALVPLGAIYEDLMAGRLVGVLVPYEGLSGAIHLVYPSARYLPLRVAKLRDFLLERLKMPEGDELKRLCREKCPEAARQKLNGKHAHHTNGASTNGRSHPVGFDESPEGSQTSGDRLTHQEVGRKRRRAAK